MASLVCALLLVTTSALVGCAGARPTLRFDQLRYPVSMTGTLLDKQGQLLAVTALENLGRFEWEGTGNAIGYSRFQLNTLDVSEPINQAIDEVSGEAMTNLHVTAPTRHCNLRNMFPLMYILPFYPGCSEIRVEGMIVRRGRAEGTESNFGPLE